MSEFGVMKIPIPRKGAYVAGLVSKVNDLCFARRTRAKQRVTNFRLYNSPRKTWLPEI